MTAPHTPWVPTEEFQGQGAAGLYGEFLTQVDASVGRILKALDEANMREDTLVILTSDNGPVWYETDRQRLRPRLDRTATRYEGRLLRRGPPHAVPRALAGPRPRRIDER